MMEGREKARERDWRGGWEERENDRGAKSVKRHQGLIIIKRVEWADVLHVH